MHGKVGLKHSECQLALFKQGHTHAQRPSSALVSQIEGLTRVSLSGRCNYTLSHIREVDKFKAETEQSEADY